MCEGEKLGLPLVLTVTLNDATSALGVAAKPGEGVDTKLGEVLWLSEVLVLKEALEDRDAVAQAVRDTPSAGLRVGARLVPVGDQDALPVLLTRREVGEAEGVGMPESVVPPTVPVTLAVAVPAGALGLLLGVTVTDTLGRGDPLALAQVVPVADTVGVRVPRELPVKDGEVVAVRESPWRMEEEGLREGVAPTGEGVLASPRDGETVPVAENSREAVAARLREGVTVELAVLSVEGDVLPLGLLLPVWLGETVAATMLAVPGKVEGERLGVDDTQGVGVMVWVKELPPEGVAVSVAVAEPVVVEHWEGEGVSVALEVRDVLTVAVAEPVAPCFTDGDTVGVRDCDTEAEPQDVGVPVAQNETVLVSVSANPGEAVMGEEVGVVEDVKQAVALALLQALAKAVGVRLPVTVGVCVTLGVALGEPLTLGLDVDVGVTVPEVERMAVPLPRAGERVAPLCRLGVEVAQAEGLADRLPETLGQVLTLGDTVAVECRPSPPEEMLEV